jgi:hypothetical protein
MISHEPGVRGQSSLAPDPTHSQKARMSWGTRQARYYDFNVWTKRKGVEKLRYMHRNPVKRGLWKSARIGLGVVSVTI